MLAAPALLGLGRLLPDEGLGLALRLAAAAACVLLVPGGIFVRAMSRPHTFGVTIAASFAWSLAALAGALALTFAIDGTIETTLWLLAGFAGVCLVPALLRAPVASEPSERKTLAGVAVAGSLFAGAVWWTANTIYGDGLFHLGRVRKLESFDLTSLSVVNEFRDGGLHPGYAFPVWHSACALIARLADVDPATALLHLPAILTPLAVVLAYAAGAALFRSPGAGVATAAAQVGLIGFSRSGTGSFDFMAQPATVSRALIAPALLALVFSFVGGGRRRQVLSIAAASLALALVHPTYAFFVAVPLLGFLVARAILATSRWRELLRVAATLPAVLLPAGLFALWLKPIVDETVSHRPDAAERARAIGHYGRQIDVVDGMLRLAPELISRGGAIVVAGLLAIPIAGLAAPKRWAAYVLGGSLAVLGLVLVPWAFDTPDRCRLGLAGTTARGVHPDPVRDCGRRQRLGPLPAGGLPGRVRLRRAAAARLSGRVLLLPGRRRARLAGLGRARRSGDRTRRRRDRPQERPAGASDLDRGGCARARRARSGSRASPTSSRTSRIGSASLPVSSRRSAPRSRRATSSSQTSRRATASRATPRSTSRPPRRRTSPTRRTTIRRSAATPSSAS